MRAKALLALASVALAVLPAPTRADERATTTYRREMLKADWFLATEDRKGWRLVVEIWKTTNEDTGEVTFQAAAARCYGFYTCGASSKRYRVTEYESDDAYTNVRAVIERGRWRHEVSATTFTPFVWIPPVTRYPADCDGGTFTRVYLSHRNATAEGHVFGHDVPAEEPADTRKTEHMVQALDVEDCP